jgi:hypothetical protein
MKELDRIFFGQPLAWREGFFYAIECKGKRAEYLECIQDIDAEPMRTQFHDGWMYAVRILEMQTKALNEAF